MTNPIERIQQRTENFVQARDEIEHTLRDERDTKCIEVVNQNVAQFLTYLHDNDYPLAEVTRYQDKDYISYELFTRTYGDGDVYFDTPPLSILIDEQENATFIVQPYHSGISFSVYAHTPREPVPFSMPTSLSTLREIEAQPGFKDSVTHFDYDDLLKWASYMLTYQQESVPHYHPTQSDFLSRSYGYRQKQYEKLRDDNFETYAHYVCDLYLASRLARQALGA